MSTVETEPMTDLDLDFLRATAPPTLALSSEADVSIVDLFSGCGGMTIGAIEAAVRLGRRARLALAIDHDPAPLDVLRKTLALDAVHVAQADLGADLEPLAAAATATEQRLLKPADGATLLLAGPPCQGHSALNNHTRHDDPRNDLYLAVARVARLLEPAAVVVENVRGIGADRRGAVSRCRAALEELGYEVVEDRLDLALLGVPQRRVRHVLVATCGRPLKWKFGQRIVRPTSWALADLLGIEPRLMIDTPSKPSLENRTRIKWLFENESFNLPNAQRPICHQDDDHSYLSMYGRLRWNAPAQTITSGFGSMGQGRFVHPLRPRTLTPHEAARLQFLPDFVAFGDVKRRGQLATMIGNVAPPALTISIVGALLRQGLL